MVSDESITPVPFVMGPCAGGGGGYIPFELAPEGVSIVQSGLMVPSGAMIGICEVDEILDSLRCRVSGGRGWEKVECGDVSWLRFCAFLGRQLLPVT